MPGLFQLFQWERLAHELIVVFCCQSTYQQRRSLETKWAIKLSCKHFLRLHTMWWSKQWVQKLRLCWTWHCAQHAKMTKMTKIFYSKFFCHARDDTQLLAVDSPHDSVYYILLYLLFCDIFDFWYPLLHPIPSYCVPSSCFCLSSMTQWTFYL